MRAALPGTRGLCLGCGECCRGSRTREGEQAGARILPSAPSSALLEAGASTALASAATRSLASLARPATCSTVASSSARSTASRCGAGGARHGATGASGARAGTTPPTRKVGAESLGGVPSAWPGSTAAVARPHVSPLSAPWPPFCCCSPHGEAGCVVERSAGRGRQVAGGAAALEGEYRWAVGVGGLLGHRPGDRASLWGPSIPTGTKHPRTRCLRPGTTAAGGERASAGVLRHPEPQEEGQGPPHCLQHHPHPVQLLRASGDQEGLSVSLQRCRRVGTDRGHPPGEER